MFPLDHLLLLPFLVFKRNFLQCLKTEKGFFDKYGFFRFLSFSSLIFHKTVYGNILFLIKFGHILQLQFSFFFSTTKTNKYCTHMTYTDDIFSILLPANKITILKRGGLLSFCDFLKVICVCCINVRISLADANWQ